MQETWLRTNRRILALGMILPGALILGGLLAVLAAQRGTAMWIFYIAWAAAALGVVLVVLLAPQMFRPRLAYADGEVLVYLRAGGPLRVPVEIVECFFLGAGVGQMPGEAGKEISLRNLVMRLAEKATDYHHRDVKAALGNWDGGYIIIHGAWCEPLRLEVVKRLNARLAEVQRLQQQGARTSVG
jgi:hypothetical protein